MPRIQQSRLTRVSDYDLRLLRIFRCVVECRGFSAAHVELNITRAAISLAIGDLESRIGVKLCERGRAGFQLTEAGEVTYEAVLRFFAALDDFQQSVNGIHAELRGELKIALINNLVTSPHMRITEALKGLRRAAPEVRVSVHMTTPTDIVRGVLDGMYHLGAVPQATEPMALETIPLYGETARLYCAQTHPLFEKDAEDLDPEAITAYDVVAPLRLHDDPEGSRYGGLRVMATSSDREGIAVLILSGEYIGYLPTHFAKRWVDAGRMRSILPKHFSYRTNHAVVYRRSVAATNRVLARYLRELAATSCSTASED